MTHLPAHQAVDHDSAPWWQRRAGWLYDAFHAGELRNHDSASGETFALRSTGVGSLSLPDGLLVAADPYVMADDARPFEQLVGQGDVQVVAVHAVVGEDHERVAALVLVADVRPVVTWRMATVAGQDVATLERESFFGYGVDAGTGSFGSPEAMRVAGRVLASDAGMLEDPVSTAMFADGAGGSSAVVVAPEAGAVPIAVCSSGWGDGYYPTWLGVAADGDVVVAVTDFLVAGDPFAAPRVEPSPPAPTDEPKSLLRRLFGG